jgi:hypothetical protein
MNKRENHSSQTGTPLDEETAQVIDAGARYFREWCYSVRTNKKSLRLSSQGFF